MVFHSFPLEFPVLFGDKEFQVCVGLRSGVCMLFREFLLQNDFQVPLAWGEGGDFETMGVRGLAQHNLNFRFRLAKGVLSLFFLFHKICT